MDTNSPMPNEPTSGSNGTGNGPGGDSPNESPLVLDLNGDGIHTTSTTDGVLFDIDGDGRKEWMGWTNPTTKDAFLWVDLNHNHFVDDGGELFGIGTIVVDGGRATDGFEALAMYDTAPLGGNDDGIISRADRIWAHLRLWVDSNHDGISQSSEIDPSHKEHVISIDLSYTVDETLDDNGNSHRMRSTFLQRDHSGAGRPTHVQRAIHDVFFRSLSQ